MESQRSPHYAAYGAVEFTLAQIKLWRSPSDSHQTMRKN